MLETHGDDPAVWVGFREDVDPALLAEKVDAQDSEWMLEHLNKINVRPGDGILVPAGQAHATGRACSSSRCRSPPTSPSSWSGRSPRPRATSRTSGSASTSCCPP